MAEQISPEGVRERLQQAALELFQERGYDRTTAAEIAARVGVTERTFFRYFPDKRETLFGGEAVLGPLLMEAVAGAPDGLGPLDLVFHAFRSIVPLLDANRSFAAPRQAVVSSTPALHERELAKHEVLADALAEALRLRGIGEPTALLAARTGMTVFTHTTIAWLGTPEPGLGERLTLMLRDLRLLINPIQSEAPRQVQRSSRPESDIRTEQGREQSYVFLRSSERSASRKFIGEQASHAGGHDVARASSSGSREPFRRA